MLLTRKKRNTKNSMRKRASLRPSKPLSASMTVEAAFVLPFFLFAFLNVISILEIYRLQSNLSSAMHLTVKEMTMAAYEYREIFDEDTGKAESLGLTYLWAANRVKDVIGEDYLDSAPLKNGASGLSWYKSSVLEEDDCIDLIATYTVTPPVSIVGFDSFAMYNRIFARAWTGYDNAAAGESQDASEEIVYITPDGTVYHKSRACTYLKLSIVPVSLEVLESERNESGAKYYPCEECGSEAKGTVYVTSYGTRYHSSLNCSKLKRTILAVPISEVGDRGACSKCAK